MGLSVNSNDLERISKALNELPKRIEKLIIRNLEYTAIEITNEIKDRPAGKPNWKDDTGNLRSSIGYMIFVNDETKSTGGFDLLGNIGNSPTSGIDVGKSFAKQIGLTLKSKYVLVIVAGMNYAEYVEKKDYDVLLYMDTETRQRVQDRLNKLDEQIDKELKTLLG